MVISFRKNFLFIHIPKCAGESITEFLLAGNNSGGQFLNKHSTYSQAERLIGKEISRFTSLAIIRNPHEQVFSFYEHLRKPKWMDLSLLERQYPGSSGRIQPKFASDIATRDEFSEYVRKIYSDGRETHVWMRDLCNWLTDADGKIATRHILRHENLNQEFYTLSKRLDLVGCLQWRNSSGVAARKTDYKDHYDNAARDIIKRHFSKTLEIFGYES